jgi:hypothetical protein
LRAGADRFVVSEVEATLGRANRRERLAFTLASSDRAGEWPENHPMNAIDGDALDRLGLVLGGRARRLHRAAHCAEAIADRRPKW